jgi:hypothetical protein
VAAINISLIFIASSGETSSIPDNRQRRKAFHRALVSKRGFIATGGTAIVRARIRRIVPHAGAQFTDFWLQRSCRQNFAGHQGNAALHGTLPQESDAAAHVRARETLGDIRSDDYAIVGCSESPVGRRLYRIAGDQAVRLHAEHGVGGHDVPPLTGRNAATGGRNPHARRKAAAGSRLRPARH